MKHVTLASKNLLRRPVRTRLTVAGVSLAVTVAVRSAASCSAIARRIDQSIERLGFQVMIMAKGCPYEAATMMLKGGTGLLYLPSDTYETVKSDAEIETITPIFVGVAAKEGSSIRDDAGTKSFSIISGIDTESFLTMKPWLQFKKGTGYDGGRWFAQDSTTRWCSALRPPSTSSARSATLSMRRSRPTARPRRIRMSSRSSAFWTAPARRMTAPSSCR